jgi:aquaporin Z
MGRKFLVELFGTAVLVFFAVGVATLMFGLKFDGGSVAAGVLATALTFGLVLLALAYAIGPISGCHLNPAVTIGALFARRISFGEALGYWFAQFLGGYAAPWCSGRSSSSRPSFTRPCRDSGRTVTEPPRWST